MLIYCVLQNYTKFIDTGNRLVISRGVGWGMKEIGELVSFYLFNFLV